MTHDIYAYVNDRYSLENQHVKDYKFMFSVTLTYELLCPCGLCIKKPLILHCQTKTMHFCHNIKGDV